MTELPPEMHDPEREALVDSMFCRTDAVYFALLEPLYRDALERKDTKKDEGGNPTGLLA